MSGPIVRTGPTPKFSENWGNIFGKKKAAPKSAAKPAKKAAKKKASKKKK